MYRAQGVNIDSHWGAKWNKGINIPLVFLSVTPPTSNHCDRLQLVHWSPQENINVHKSCKKNQHVPLIMCCAHSHSNDKFIDFLHMRIIKLCIEKIEGKS